MFVFRCVGDLVFEGGRIGEVRVYGWAVSWMFVFVKWMYL